jgi:aminoglycoside phosphotransferase (APT) family kinase protein
VTPEVLGRWLASATGDPDVTIDNLRRTSYGFSRENWVFDALWAGRRARLICRRDPVGSVLSTDRAVEEAVLRALWSSPVPVPELRWADVSGEWLDRPAIVMDLVEGDCDPFVLNGDRPLPDRVALAHRIYDQLAGIHLLDWRMLGLGQVLEDPGPKAALVAVDHWEAELRRVQLEPEPELEAVLWWLRSSAPSSPRTVLVHGDFKPGNLLLRRGEVAAVLDWETAHLGDPREDLGWVTNPLRAGEHRIAGAWEPADLLARWSAQTAWEADAEAVRWWQVLANFKLCVIVLTGTRAFVQGRFDRIHLSPVVIYRLMLDQIGA